MKLTRFLALAAFALPVLAQAHPGHEGHELTWDFDHLVAHPAATGLCFLVLAAGGAIILQWIGVRRAKESAARSRTGTRR